jgi:hypothetical protein
MGTATGSPTGRASATSSSGAFTTASNGNPEPVIRLRRGAPELTTGSSICRSRLSRYRSKSFICIRNASHNGSTQGLANSFGREDEPRSSRREWLSGAPGRGFVFGRNLRLSPARKGKPPVAVSQVMGQLDHLQAQPARSEAFRRQHEERPDENLSARPVQLPPRNHQHLENAADRWSIGSRGSSFWTCSTQALQNRMH